MLKGIVCAVLVYKQQLHYYNHFMALWILSGTTRMSLPQKGKTITNLDFLEQETVSGNWIIWAKCKFALCHRQITM